MVVMVMVTSVVSEVESGMEESKTTFTTMK
jgi:hypothetical protein